MIDVSKADYFSPPRLYASDFTNKLFVFLFVFFIMVFPSHRFDFCQTRTHTENLSVYHFTEGPRSVHLSVSLTFAQMENQIPGLKHTALSALTDRHMQSLALVCRFNESVGLNILHARLKKV